MEKRNFRKELEAVFTADDTIRFPKAFAEKVDLAVRKIIANVLKEGDAIDIPSVMTIFPVTASAKEGKCAGKAYSVPERVMPKAKFSSSLKKSL